MAVQAWGPVYRGLSTDRKPTVQLDGAWIFIEEDTGSIYTRNENGVWTLINRKSSIGGGIVSIPPVGCKQIYNIYVTEDGKVMVEFDTGG